MSQEGALKGLSFSDVFDAEDDITFDDVVNHGLTVARAIRDKACEVEPDLVDSEAVLLWEVLGVFKSLGDDAQKGLRDALLERAKAAGGKSETSVGSITRSVVTKPVRNYVPGYEDFLDSKGLFEKVSKVTASLRPEVNILDIPEAFLESMGQYFDLSLDPDDSRIEACVTLGELTLDELDNIYEDSVSESYRLSVKPSKDLKAKLAE